MSIPKRSADARRLQIVSRAARRYAIGLRQGTSSCRADGNSETQQSNYHEALERVELRAEQIRQVLMDHGVMLIHFVFYRNFGLHVDKLVRTYSGETLRMQALTALERWRAYGCDPTVLKEVCRQVFELVMD